MNVASCPFGRRAIAVVGGTSFSLALAVGRWSPSVLLTGTPIDGLITSPITFGLLALSATTILLYWSRPPRAARSLDWGFAFPWLVLSLVPVLWAAFGHVRGAVGQDRVVWLLATLVLTVALSSFWVVAGFDHAERSLVIGLLAVTLPVVILGLVAPTVGYGSRVSVLGGGPITFGRLAALTGVGTMVVYRAAKPRSVRTVAAGSGAMAVLAIALSGSRGAALAFVVGFLVWAYAESLGPHRLAGWALVAGLVGAVGLGGAQGVSERVHTTVSSRVATVDGLEALARSSRVTFAHDAVECARASPVVGAGVGAFSRTGTAEYPHNLALELACEYGAVPLSALILGLGLLASELVRTSRSPEHWRAGLLGMFAATLTASMFSGDIYDNRWVVLLGLALALTSCRRGAVSGKKPFQVETKIRRGSSAF